MSDFKWRNNRECTMDKRKFLKIKLKSLMAESKIIRKEEGRTRDPELREAMHRHRVMDLRAETRATRLAYAILRGHPYSKVERCGPLGPNHPERRPVLDLGKVAAMLRKYGPGHMGNATNLSVQTWMTQEPRVS